MNKNFTTHCLVILAVCFGVTNFAGATPRDFVARTTIITESCADQLIRVPLANQLEYGLLEMLLQSVYWDMERIGLATRDRQTGTWTTNTTNLLGYLGSLPADKARKLRDYLIDAHCELCARQAPAGTPPSRAGVDHHEIASTIRDIARLVLEINPGPSHSKIAEKWLSPQGIADQIDNLNNQDALERLFGRGDPQNHYQMALIPTLGDMRDLLRFLAYRENLERQSSGRAQVLLERLDAFRGSFGPRHAAHTDQARELGDLISSSARHTSEVYQEPANIQINYPNAANLAFNHSEYGWLPTENGQVEWRHAIATHNSYNNFDGYADRQATILEGLQRAGINATIKVVLGSTYGEDRMVVSMTMNDYTQRFVPVKMGRNRINLKMPPESGFSTSDMMAPNTSSHFLGWEPGKRVFMGPEGLYVVANGTMQRSTNSTNSTSTENELRNLRSWLRKDTWQFVRNVWLPDPTQPGRRLEYAVFEEQQRVVGTISNIRSIGGRYWTFNDLYNERCRVFNRMVALSNGYQQKTQEREPTGLARVTDQEAYVSYSGPYEQAVLHVMARFQVDIPTFSAEGIGSEGNQIHRSVLRILQQQTNARTYYIVEKNSVSQALWNELVAAINSIDTDINRGGTGYIDLAGRPLLTE